MTSGSGKRSTTIGGSIAYNVPSSGALSCTHLSLNGGRLIAPPLPIERLFASAIFSSRRWASSFAGSMLGG